MWKPKNLDSLIELLNISDKKTLERHCKNLVIHSSDFFGLILAARAGALEPYRYECHFDHRVPEHLNPSHEELDAVGRTKVGPPEGKAKKFFTKVNQAFQERKLFAAHLLYTPQHDYWHLFYFDQRDRDEYRNHWKHGAHIHYVSNLCVNLPLQEVWRQAQSARLQVPKSFHLRYEDPKRA